MDVTELKQTHPLYEKHLKEWQYNQLAYDGGEEFIKDSLAKQTRESEANWSLRVKDGVCFNYAKMVIDIYAYYLTEQHPVRELGLLAEDPLFKAFEKDCDLMGTDFDYFIKECQKLASATGAIGILVDKPPVRGVTRQQELEGKIYPYCSAYTLPNILDWRFEKDPTTGRPELTWLKLKEEDGTFKIWTPGRWEQWSVEVDPRRKEEAAVMIHSGEVGIGIIPFVWMQNIKSITRPRIGVPDITEISRITASITRDISCGDEIIKYAGFPMLRKPMRSAGDNSEDLSGATAILEFDPERGKDGKPDWLEAPTKEPIEAVLNWIDKKSGEAMKMAHLGGIHAQEVSGNVRSGVALRYEFQQLSRVLTAKSVNMNEAEMKIINFFMLWQGLSNDKEVVVNRPNDFSIDDLSVTLENLDIAGYLVASETYQKELQKTIVRKTSSHSNSEKLNLMYAEIEGGEIPMRDRSEKFSLRDRKRQDSGYRFSGTKRT